MSESIVGSWYIGAPGGGTDQIVFTFLADGTYLVADKGTVANDPTGTSGLEWGSYTWDASTGALSLTAAINTDGEWGLSPHLGTSNVTATVADNVVTFTGFEESFSVPRLMSPPDSIVGSWYLAPPPGAGGTDQVVFTFLADGSLLVADKGTVANDPSGTSGIEWGSYTWNALTGAAVINIQVNTDGQWGFASAAPETIEMVLQVSGDVLNVLVSDGDGGSLARLSPLSSITITGTPGPDALAGASTVETILGLAGNDSLAGAGGNDTLDGGAGIDTGLYSSTLASYAIAATAGGFTVTGSTDGTDSLTGIERLQFSDAKVALDLDGNAGNVARIIGAVFGSASVTNREYVGIGLAYMDNGMGYQDLMQLAIDYRLGSQAMDPTAVVNLLYGNVIGGLPSAPDLATYTGMMTSGMSAGALGMMAANTAPNEMHIGLAGLMQTGIEYF